MNITWREPEIEYLFFEENTLFPETFRKPEQRCNPKERKASDFTEGSPNEKWIPLTLFWLDNDWYPKVKLIFFPRNGGCLYDFLEFLDILWVKRERSSRVKTYITSCSKTNRRKDWLEFFVHQKTSTPACTNESELLQDGFDSADSTAVSRWTNSIDARSKCKIPRISWTN